MKNLKDLLKPNYKVHLETLDKGVIVEIKGKESDILVALSTFVQSLKESGTKDEYIKYAVNLGLKSKEEVEQDTQATIDKLLSKLFD